MENFKKLEEKLLDFLDSYLKLTKSAGFSIGVSGGLDSAVVATLCSKVAKTYALIMPTNSSNKANLDDALALCDTLKVERTIINIQPILDEFLKATGDTTNLRRGNLSARIRMTLLYDHSAKLKTLVAGTSNKSERMLGYGTIYGDLACALNPIGEIYKSDLFEFAKYLGISQNIITKAPSADLYEGQSDELEIGFSYAQLDAVLKDIENQKTKQEIEAKFDEKLLQTIFTRIELNKFKLSMPPIANIN
ncbi:NAD synthetase, NH3-dependent [Campylobacter iguaniorum]|uniref:NAD+ synthase n=1 Tax=Campylobacter iguaniorum TaxID=1244531 RepID=UPI00073A3E10|nr:NAD+ synthase [Campylobacter iguaniorum]ALV24786.1 NAD synthetase, NH3-dependent [Campylobacter iguaniorum]